MKLFILSLLFFQLFSAVFSQGCLQVKPLADGSLFSIKNSGSQYWGTSVVTFTLKNTCSKGSAFKNLVVSLENWLVNGKAVSNAYLNQNGSPYLSSSVQSVSNGLQITLNTPDCTQYCDWAQLAGQGEISFMLTAGVSSSIYSSNLGGLQISGGQDDIDDNNNNDNTDNNNNDNTDNNNNDNTDNNNNINDNTDNNSNNNNNNNGKESPISADSISTDTKEPFTNISPYADITVGAVWSDWQNYPQGTPFDFSSIVDQAGITGFSLAFIQEGGKCLPAWAGTAAMAADDKVHWGKELADRFRTKKTPFIISFGGAAGTDLAYGCGSDLDLADAYERVYKIYQPTGFDYDIEGGLQTDAAATNKIFSAMKILQGSHPNLKLSLTLPVMPWGLTDACKKLIKSAQSKNVIFNVNIMTMDYGAGYDANQAQNTIDAAYNTFSFLKSIYPSLSDAQLWKKVEVTPMIGVNDVQTEIFTLRHADIVREFARKYGLGAVHFWSAGRDHPCSGVSAKATCSSGNVQTKDWEFSMHFSNKLNSPTPTPNPNPDPNPTPTPTPDPEPNPNPSPNPEPNPNPTPSPSGVAPFLPYADVTINVNWAANTPFDFSTIIKPTGINGIVFAFIQDSGNCVPGWGGQPSMSVSSKWGLAMTNKLLSSQVPFVISMGGAAGSDLSLGCGTASELAKAYELIYTTYSPSGLDFDIEGALSANTNAVNKILSALKTFQAAHPKVPLSFTIATMPEGLDHLGLGILKLLVASGLKYSVNIMTMDYGAAYSGDMAQYAIQAAKSLYNSLKTYYPNLSSQELWKMVEVTPMIGINDVNVEKFTLQNAATLRDWARSVGLGAVHMWSVARDVPCSSTFASATCSGGNLQSQPNEFMITFSKSS